MGWSSTYVGPPKKSWSSSSTYVSLSIRCPSDMMRAAVALLMYRSFEDIPRFSVSMLREHHLRPTSSPVVMESATFRGY